MKQILMVIPLSFLLSYSFSQSQKNFNGTIVYRVSFSINDVQGESRNVTYHFTDSAIYSYSRDSTTLDTYDLKNAVEILEVTDKDIKKTIEFSDNIGLINKREEMPNDSLVVLNIFCKLARIEKSEEIAISTLSQVYEFYLSPLVYVCPATIKDFNFLFNNTFGHIPLKVRSVSDFMDHHKVTEFEAISITSSK